MKDLEAAGLLRKLADASGGHVYALTAAGKALEPAILALVRWGFEHLPDRKAGYHHQDDWDLVALKAAFQPSLAASTALLVQFRSATLVAWVDLRERALQAGLGERNPPDLVVNGTVRDLFVTAEDPAALLVAGTPQELKQFMSAFAVQQS